MSKLKKKEEKRTDRQEKKEKMGCSVYDVLQDIGRTMLLSPKPWKPGERR